MGYHRAGFDVVGVDINPQPHYPFEFIQNDAIIYLQATRADYAIVHASPPCQPYSTTRTLHSAKYEALVPFVRACLRHKRLPYVIENVPGSPLDPFVQLCGSMFGLGVRRHRRFESSVMLFSPGCDHASQPEPLDVTGTGSRRLGERLDGKGGNSRKPRNLAEAQAAMGIDWMTRPELSEAIPPAYTEFIGSQLLEQLVSP